MANFLLSLVFLSNYFFTFMNCQEDVWREAVQTERTLCRGRYSREASFTNNYEIVVPRKVDADGGFVSHQIPHHYKRSYYRGRKRAELAPEDALHYRVSIDGEEYHLELYPNHRLVGPGAVVEERRPSRGRSTLENEEDFIEGTTLRRLRDTQCHYHGRVRDHRDTTALSTCYGLQSFTKLPPRGSTLVNFGFLIDEALWTMAGYIRTKRSLYMIEPVAGHDYNREREHPHIIYRRSPGDFKRKAEALCNTTDNLARSIAKRARDLGERDPPKIEARAYTIELLAVLDKSLLDYHRAFDVENYVLTLFNMAAGLFQDVSLGVEMELVIVRIIRLEVEEDEMNLSVNKDAETTMKYFQEWQKKINPGDDTHPNHHDCAILITKIDICSTQTVCGFTGMSTIAGTCDPVKGAAVVKDNGLQTGYEIAHQIGHTIGMSHDVEEDNGCPGIIYHQNGYVETTVMYPGYHYVTKRWSKCSQSCLKLYIEDGLASCLKDEAQDHHFSSIEMLPGVIYSGDDQCRLRYRQDARQCDLGITCETLKCAIPGRGCISGRKPPAEGTPCGEKKWCYQMKCLTVGDRPSAIDGGWSSWSPWSHCSRTCGSGVAFCSRKCNHPPPSRGGEYCRGDWKRHKICATQPCEVGAPSFRDVQCAEFNDWTFPEDQKVHQWIGYNLPENLKASENPCVLFCLSENKLLTSLKPKVVDGTTCYRGIRDICVGGTCREIPCDLDMESEAVEDMCGVCKGDGTSCLLKEGVMNVEEQQRLKKVIDIPVGAKNIRVEESQPTKSRIVVRSKSTKHVLIDGNRLGMFDLPGSKAWLGMIRAKQEALNIPGPVTEDLVVLVYPRENVTLKYSLGLKPDVARKPAFDWHFIEWSRCNAPCGPGEEIAKPRCVEKIGGQVDDNFCSNIIKPEVKVRPCNQAPCVPRWMIGDWQGCVPCAPNCKKIRAVKCIRPVGHGEQEADVIADGYCQGPKPKESESGVCLARRQNTPLEVEETPENSVVAAGDIAPGLSHTAQSSNVSPRSALSKRSKESNRETVDSDLNESVKGISGIDGNADNIPQRRIERGIEADEHDNDLKIDTGSVDRKNDIRMQNDPTLGMDIQKRTGHDGDAPNGANKVMKGQVIVDKEDIKNFTLTIILERDDDNAIVNFPMDFRPQPPENGTEFTLVGMDAVKYIQRIQEEGKTTSEVPPT